MKVDTEKLLEELKTPRSVRSLSRQFRVNQVELGGMLKILNEQGKIKKYIVGRSYVYIRKQPV